jgi:hypothetical protein
VNRAKLLMELAGHLIHAELDDRNVGCRRVQIAVQLGPRQRQLRVRELFETTAETDEHQVRFVPQHLHGGRRSGIGHRQRTQCFIRHALQIRRSGAAQAFPANAEHQVKDAPAFE